jgi:hypothetical protein
MSENEKEQVIGILLMLGALFIAVGAGLAYWVKWWAGTPAILFGIVWLFITFGAAVQISRGGGTPCP